MEVTTPETSNWMLAIVMLGLTSLLTMIGVVWKTKPTHAQMITHVDKKIEDAAKTDREHDDLMIQATENKFEGMVKGVQIQIDLLKETVATGHRELGAKLDRLIERS